MAVQRSDILWKGIIEDFFEPLLRFFFRGADQLFDFTKGFVFLDKELAALSAGRELQHPKVVDKLVRVFTRSGTEKWFLVHLEVQGYAPKDFARRMFTYYSRILDRHKMPVTCIVIFLGKRGKRNVSFFEQEYLGSKIRFEYNAYYVGEQDEEELKKMSNPFAIVVLTALMKLKYRKNVAELFKSKLALARNLLRSGLSKGKTERLLAFLNYYVHFEDKRLNIKFERQLALLTNKTSVKMGIIEQLQDIAKKSGLEKGLKLGERKGVKLGERKGIKEGKQSEALSIARQLKVLGVSLEIIRKSTGLSVRRIKTL